MEYTETEGSNADFLLLCRLLDEHLDRAVGGAKNRAQYIPYNLADGIENVILAYDGKTVVGCAGLRRYGGECAELKRVFVRAEYRNSGIGKELITRIAERAKSLGFKKLILETGEILKEATTLYRTCGFYKTENYPPYTETTDSFCMEKILDY
ncbi:MAG: GNAT family N-acetyltransferase [Clostridiales bacterium]|jgi:N-acetylglutamate synthase-like GNAT family acetyltransferase|nr:GNAT family N-acetyltransferase [Clostridiales bacterium]